MKMFKKSVETDEEYYVRHYKKLQAEPVSLGGSTPANGGFCWFISQYPRSDPTSPQRFRADNSDGAAPAALVAGIVASMFLTPIGGMVVGGLVHEFFKRRTGVE